MMPPSPDNDGPPKAPDKDDDKRGPNSSDNNRKPADDPNKQETDFYNLNEKDLKHLLDEAISYKSPKDREGKSELFNNLLTDAENELRNARATSASGPETVRHYNKRATKRHGKGGRKANSISENLTHSGSLNNLTKEDLFEETVRQRLKKTVSSRQTEGGSLPCNVNVGAFDQYLDDFRPMRELTEVKLIPDERKKNESDVIESFTAALKTKKSQKISNVDDRIPILDNLPTVDVVEYKKSSETTISNSFLPVNFSASLAAYNGRVHREEKDETRPTTVVNFPSNILPLICTQKVDENCNAVTQQQQHQQQQHQQPNDGRKKTKKRPMEKNVTVLESSKVTGHRSDIIDDVDKLIDFIAGNDVRKEKANKQNVPNKKNLQKHHLASFDDAKATKKQRARTSKPKTGSNLQKSNSLEEISTTKIEDFSFENDVVVLRQPKGDRPRERRSWGNSEPVQVQTLYTNASAENLETADFRVVTKKKKSKKQRRNSLSSRKTYREETSNELTRVPSPEPRRKSAISVPHSEKSNDSSDADSVHSLPVDATTNLSREIHDDDSNFPISYADIAKNANNFVLCAPSGGNSVNNININNNNGVSNKSIKKEKQNSTEIVDSDKIKVKKEEENRCFKKETRKDVVVVEEKVVTNLNSVNYSQNFPSIVSKIEVGKIKANPIAEIQTWPAIPNNGNGNKNNLNVKNSISKQKNIQNHYKNTKNTKIIEKNSNSENNSFVYTTGYVPINIQDVRSLEKQFKSTAKLYVDANQPNVSVQQQQKVQQTVSVQCELQKRDDTSASVRTIIDGRNPNSNNNNHHNNRPAVVMLSGATEDVSGITFGFDFEQLLSNDVCADFMARYVPPRCNDVGKSFNLDKIVNFIGIAWEDVVKETNGKVQYYTESL
ncbi:uncharacterized protein DDB_G0283697-like isoform X1 [Onthophagus taurus]|uniref:uncharacterized protein DDB_G0283697-like isoform X1 n=1 Tax=Onthophagus taurus TaxID=166361 RepID=UPI0039BE1CDC